MITCSGVCLCQPQGQAGEVKPGTRRLCRKSARLIFPVRIWVAKALSAFLKSEWIFGRFLSSEAVCAIDGSITRV